jgi:predicted MFS family arabinose efflux permease
MRSVSPETARPVARRPLVVVAALGAVQILAWGTSFYIPAVLAEPIVADTGWSLGWVVGGVSIGLLVAGLISPRVGSLIDKKGGRPVLAASSLLYAAGLAGIGLSPTLPVYLLAWAVLGAGMGTGLYDAVFAALGKLYGKDARMPITNLTLFGGFASTVCWPLSAYLESAVGWRGTCLTYAAIHLCIALPLHLAVFPRGAQPRAESPNDDASPPPPAAGPLRHPALVFVLLAAIMSIAAGIGSIVVVHLLIFLQARGVDFVTAVWLGTLFGPAQVAARVIERLFGRHYHPVWTMIACCVLMAAGLAILLVDLPLVLLAILLYGGGYGISWIARGTLPLALFGPERYAVLIGRLAFPSLIVQALAPFAGALLVERYGAHPTVAVLTAFAAINVALIGTLWVLCRRPAGVKMS